MQKALAIALCKMHRYVMRSHSDIIKAAGIEAVIAVTAAPENTVRSWVRRDKVPDEHWKRFSDARFATLNELATYAEVKRQQPVAA